MYIFKNTAGDILYVGKAKVLRQRVRSYFQPPIKLLPKTAQLVVNIASLEHIEVGSEFEALLLESRLINKFKPPYNIISKDDKSPYFIHVTREDYPKPIINHEPKGALAGPFLNNYVPRTILRHLRTIAPFCTSQRPVKRPCFYSHLGQCNPCPAYQDKAGYAKNIIRLKKLLKGEFKAVASELKHHMESHAKVKEFEQAASIRDQIKALDYLLQTPIAPEEYLVNPNLMADRRQESLDALIQALSTANLTLSSLHRIELYDNAHLMGTSPTSAMVVAIDGEVTNKNYRHFTIKSPKSNSDVGMMSEVLTRRLKRTDWGDPSLIVLDGGMSQLSSTHGLNTTVPFIALAKQEEIIYLPNGKHLDLPKNHPGLRLLQRLRDEAHRFSRRLHHKARKRSLTS